MALLPLRGGRRLRSRLGRAARPRVREGDPREPPRAAVPGPGGEGARPRPAPDRDGAGDDRRAQERQLRRREGARPGEARAGVLPRRRPLPPLRGRVEEPPPILPGRARPRRDPPRQDDGEAAAVEGRDRPVPGDALRPRVRLDDREHDRPARSRRALGGASGPGPRGLLPSSRHGLPASPPPPRRDPPPLRRGRRVISVILSGDDFGLAPAINEGIALAHAQGCLTSASLSVAGPAAEDAASRARSLPSLGVGLHLTLVAERPVSRAGDVPTLVAGDGRFHPSAAAFATRWLSRRIRPEEVRREVRAQLERARALGISLTHLDSHQHVHVLPGLLPIVLEEMGGAGLRRLRIPLETARWPGAGWGRRAQRGVLNALARRAARQARGAGFAFPDRFVGFLGAGRVDGDGLLARIDGLEDGVTEIGLHPAAGAGPPREDFASWGYRWSGELDALLDPRVRGALDRRGVRRVSFEACAVRG